MPVASSVCLVCGWPEADPEFFREDGILRMVSLTCRRCGTVSVLSWPES